MLKNKIIREARSGEPQLVKVTKKKPSGFWANRRRSGQNEPEQGDVVAEVPSGASTASSKKKLTWRRVKQAIGFSKRDMADITASYAASEPAASLQIQDEPGDEQIKVEEDDDDEQSLWSILAEKLCYWELDHNGEEYFYDDKTIESTNQGNAATASTNQVKATTDSTNQRAAARPTNRRKATEYPADSSGSDTTLRATTAELSLVGASGRRRKKISIKEKQTSASSSLGLSLETGREVCTKQCCTHGGKHLSDISIGWKEDDYQTD